MIQNHAKGKKNRDGARKKFDRRKHDMELWDIYDENKQLTGRTMKRNDWHMKPGEFHLTVLGVIARPDGTFLITKRVMTKAWAPGWWEVSGGNAFFLSYFSVTVQMSGGCCRNAGIYLLRRTL